MEAVWASLESVTSLPEGPTRVKPASHAFTKLDLCFLGFLVSLRSRQIQPHECPNVVLVYAPFAGCENVAHTATSCGWEINCWRLCAWLWIVRHRSLCPQRSQWQCPVRRYSSQRLGQRLGRFPCRRPRRCRLYSGLVSSLALWSSNPAAGSEAAFPTPCLDTSPCPVVVSVVCTHDRYGRRGVEREEGTQAPNQPDRRSPGRLPRGGEHG